MTFDPENIPLNLNDWFSTQVVYEGRGRAEFLDPSGAVEGPARVQINEDGTSSIELDIESIESEEPLPLGLMQLFSSQKPTKGSNWIGISGGGEPPNTCTSLTVTTPNGEFSATEGIRYGYSVDIGSGRSGKLDFYMLRSQFDAAGKSLPRYWVMPLSNFLSRFVANHPTLDRHPLRFYPTPVLPEGLEETDAFIATHNANLKNRLITFEFMGKGGFIEPMPDYGAREKNLTEGCARHSITAVMVGDVGSNSIEQADLKAWFPDDFLRLLSIVTGTPVGSPWIEFRNDQGELVRCIHVKLNLSPFSKGHRPLEEGVHSGTGYLLNKYQSSPERGKSYLNVVLKHLFHVARSGQSIEDKFIYLARALENLCQRYEFKGQELMQSLDAHWQHVVRGILSTAEKQIRLEAREAARLGQPDHSRTLDAIAERTLRTPGGKENSFGLAVSHLLKHFKLPDADIVDAHYLANPRPDGIQSWSSVLSKYRGAPVHTGFFNISENVHDFDDVWTIETHLHDVLLRILFKIIGYDGTYQPPVRTMASTTPVDWVVPGLPASELGYK
jgi:hypothetical protein